MYTQPVALFVTADSGWAMVPPIYKVSRKNNAAGAGLRNKANIEEEITVELLEFLQPKLIVTTHASGKFYKIISDWVNAYGGSIYEWDDTSNFKPTINGFNSLTPVLYVLKQAKRYTVMTDLMQQAFDSGANPIAIGFTPRMSSNDSFEDTHTYYWPRLFASVSTHGHKTMKALHNRARQTSRPGAYCLVRWRKDKKLSLITFNGKKWARPGWCIIHDGKDFIDLNEAIERNEAAVGATSTAPSTGIALA